MSMKSFTSFLSEESGAVTVDWVVLTAALVGLGLAVISVVSSGLENLSGDIRGQLEADHVTAGFSSSSTTTTTTTTTD
ncbi:pilus assembly protein [Nioella aestuarii]|uniref:pilus assembly protein n=1 Tax=Nioella aestuarii TaxID=1662864 RepID=UPI003D7F508A